MEKEIINVLHYFAFFSYPPTVDELHTFLKVPVKKDELLNHLSLMVKRKKILKFEARYTLGEYSIFKNIFEKRCEISKKKIQKASKFIHYLAIFPQIKLIGLSGSVSMVNAEEKDDIDLFIITTTNRMWTARFIALVLSQFMGVRRKRNEKNTKDKVCLNLFFDEQNVEVPALKRTEYTAHEVLQMKPVIIKGEIYKEFVEKNSWVNTIFPNAKINYIKKYQRQTIDIKNRLSPLNFLSNFIEQLLRYLQLFIINKHKTTEIITDTQLWFFPRDFEKEIKKRKV